jgi:hypothetical protein
MNKASIEEVLLSIPTHHPSMKTQPPSFISHNQAIKQKITNPGQSLEVHL